MLVVINKFRAMLDGLNWIENVKYSLGYNLYTYEFRFCMGQMQGSKFTART